MNGIGRSNRTYMLDDSMLRGSEQKRTTRRGAAHRFEALRVAGVLVPLPPVAAICARSRGQEVRPHESGSAALIHSTQKDRARLVGPSRPPLPLPRRRSSRWDTVVLDRLSRALRPHGIAAQGQCGRREAGLDLPHAAETRRPTRASNTRKASTWSAPGRSLTPIWLRTASSSTWKNADKQTSASQRFSFLAFQSDAGSFGASVISGVTSMPMRR